MSKILYQEGQVIGKCIFIKEIASNSKWSSRRAIFRCQCGNNFESAICHVKALKTVSCKCKKKIQNPNASRRTHGQTTNKKSPPEYTSWVRMKSRCYYKGNKDYHNYGGRGIIVCDRWKNSFENFLEDMGYKNSPNMTVDRIDTDLNYSPENCRWATPKQQGSNRRNNVRLCLRGENKTISEWGIIFGISATTISSRIKSGMNPESAITMPSKKNKKWVITT